MIERIFRPTFASMAPHLLVDLFNAVPMFLFWAIYYFIMPEWYVMVLAIVSTLSVVWLSFTSLGVVTCRIVVTDLTISGSRYFISFPGSYWIDIEKIEIFEKLRDYLPPKRTDRLIQVYAKGRIVVSINSCTWPENDEEDFLNILYQAHEIYGFTINRQTSKI